MSFADSARAAEKFLATGEVAQACSLAERLTELHPTDHQAWELLARSWALAAASASDESGRKVALQKALDSYRITCRLAPTWAPILHATGVIAGQLGYTPEAIERFGQAARADPTNPQFPLFEGLALLQSNRLDAARERLSVAAQLAPDSPWPLAALSEESRMSGHCDRALDLAREARRLDPTSVSLRIAESKALRSLSRHQEVLELLGGLSRLDRALEATAWELAAAHTAVGNPVEAAQAWEVHAAKGPPSGALHAARAWIAANDLARALNWLDAAELAGATPAEVAQVSQEITAATDRHQAPAPAP